MAGRRVTNRKPAFFDEDAMKNEDIDDYDETDEFSSEIATQLARLAEKYEVRERGKIRRQRHTLKVRRQLEDWSDKRRIREEIDYLD